MSRANYLASVLDELAADLGIGRVVLNEDNRATLRVEGIDVLLAYTESPVEVLWLYVELGSIPGQGDEAPAFLLQRGLISWVHGRMTIGLDPSGRGAQGFVSVPIALLDAAGLRSMLTVLVEEAQPLREHLARGDYTLVQDGGGLDQAEVQGGPDLLDTAPMKV